MDKDEYASTFSGSVTASNFLEVRIITTDELSSSEKRQATDLFVIELSLGCTDDRIVPPPVIEAQVMLMESTIDEGNLSPDVIVDLSNYESVDAACRPYASIKVERDEFGNEEFVSASDDITRFSYLDVDLEAESLTIQNPQIEYFADNPDSFNTYINIKVTYYTGAQAEGLVSDDEVESQIFQIRFTKKGHENCYTNELILADDYEPIRKYVLGTGPQDIVASEFFLNPRATLCPTTFTLK